MSTAPASTDLAPRMTGAEPPPPKAVVAAVEFLEEADPFPPEVVAKLARPLDPADVEAKPPHGLLYAPWSKYQDVLLDAFGPGGFRMVPLSPHRQQGKEMAWHGALLVRIPGQRKFQFVKSAVGECAMHEKMSYPNAVEGAQSDCLMKCCKALGIYKELFDPAWRRAWEAKYKGQHQKDVAQAQWPVARAGAAAAPKAPAAPAPASPPAATPIPASVAAPVDTGEPASDADKAEIRAIVGRLGWKKPYAKMWLRQTTGGKANGPDELSALEARDVLIALEGEVLREAAK